ncbi:MAG: hypothetical protein GX443_17500 [Deltaproteobacteria bacterium]|nr:hypothetical protein [Deltaproteobacteria bacterium]
MTPMITKFAGWTNGENSRIPREKGSLNMGTNPLSFMPGIEMIVSPG